MARIAVLGGSGFLGSRVVKALRKAGADVSVASRRSEVAIDVTKPESWEALAPFDVVVDLSDTVSTPPDALIAWLLARGKCVIEGTSDAPCVERLAKAHEGTKGRLVLGGGIFTGVSNLLARDVAKRAGAVEAVQLGISSSPFSGAGTGTIALMANAIGVAPVRYENGLRVEEGALLRGPLIDFGTVTRPTGVMSLAEPSMLARSTGAKKVDVYFAPRPGFLVGAFTIAPLWLGRQRWYQAFMRAYFTVLRKFLLKNTESAVELVASARGTTEARRWVHTSDGMEAGGVALAAMTEAVARAQSWSGVRCIDDVTDLEPIVARANELAGSALLTVSPPLTGAAAAATTRAA
jgi:short subunit dehydrogenase-like uncharacterized protein